MKTRKRYLNDLSGFDIEDIRKMLRVGRNFDLETGGCCDARMGCINFWAGPDDKPEGYDAEITQGALSYPKAVVGSLMWTAPEEGHEIEGYQLYLDISPYELNEYYKNNLPEHLWQACEEWLVNKTLEVIRLSRLLPEDCGVKCPLCDYVLPVGHMLNDLIKHMSEHGKVTNIVFGGPKTTVKVNDVDYTLEMEEKFL